jgi:hypothetical protein
MATPEIAIYDARMLQLMEECVKNKVQGIKTQKAWCELVGANPHNIPNIRAGNQGFSKESYRLAAVAFGVSMDWLFGIIDAPEQVVYISVVDQIKALLDQVGAPENLSIPYHPKP